MLVEMVRLRHGGGKLPRETVLASTPMRGELTVEVRDGVVRAILLPDAKLPDDMPVLQDCRMTRLRGSSLVLVGRVLTSRRRGAALVEQAWWCWLPGTRREEAPAGRTRPREPQLAT
jgi:hypothetical protein